MAARRHGWIYSQAVASPCRYNVGRPAPIVQRPRTPPFQGGNGDSNSPGGTTRGRGEVWSSRRPVKPEVAGSNPVAPARINRSDRKVRAFGQVAQLVEHRSEKPGVGGSSPPLTTTSEPLLRRRFGIQRSDSEAGVPKQYTLKCPMGTTEACPDLSPPYFRDS